MIRKLRKIVLTVGAVLLSSVHLHAHDLFRRDSLELDVHFRQDYRNLELSYRDNRDVLDRLSQVIRESMRDGTLESIDVKAYASPEGGQRYNERLALARTEVLASWIVKNCGVPSGMVKTSSGGVGWDRLREQVAMSDVHYRNEVLDIIDNTPAYVVDSGGKIAGGRKAYLMELEGGKVWRDMDARFFPEVRCCLAIVITKKELRGPEVIRLALAPVDPVDPAPVSSARMSGPDMMAIVVPPFGERKAEIPVDEPAGAKAEGDTSVYFALRTNLLQDALLIPSAGVEFHISDGWSVSANWQYAWWRSDRARWYWRTYGGDLTVRKYFGGKSGMLRGHHAGLYGQIYTYDFELGGPGVIGGVPGGTLFDRFNYGGGLEYGYSFSIGRHLNLDLSLGLGYSGGEFHEYMPVDGCYVWRATKIRHYWGPTKAEVSLVWLLGADKFNNRKRGGAR